MPSLPFAHTVGNATADFLLLKLKKLHGVSVKVLTKQLFSQLTEK
jgi:hypothetical protein